MYKINKQVLEAVLKYLATRPYQEVANLINVLQGSQEIKEDSGQKAKEQKGLPKKKG